MKALKQLIKTKASLQKDFKNQRKTINLVGTRTISSSEAAYKHFIGRDELRYLYAAYGILRGRTIEQVESNPKEPLSMSYVDKLVAQYYEAPIEQITAA